MIIFRGEPSGECKDLVRKYNKKNSGFFLLAVEIGIFLLLGIPAAIEIGWETLLILVPMFVGGWFLATLFDNGLGNLPCEVCIDHESINVRDTHKNEMYVLFENVGSIVDMGTYYKIIGINGKVMPMYSCQKDLIVEGTLEEFEKIFEGKIVKE